MLFSVVINEGPWVHQFFVFAQYQANAVAEKSCSKDRSEGWRGVHYKKNMAPKGNWAVLGAGNEIHQPLWSAWRWSHIREILEKRILSEVED